MSEPPKPPPDKPPGTDADFDALPPLVAPGEDRDAVLDRLADSWSRDWAPLKPYLDNRKPFLQSIDVRHDRMLWIAGRALIDGNTGDPIDLGAIIDRIQLRLAGRPEGDQSDGVSYLFITGCDIRLCRMADRNLRIGFHAHWCRFADGSSFANTTFDLSPSFLASRFGDGTTFSSATFGLLTNFDSVTFGDLSDFTSATFGLLTNFGSATFGDLSNFGSATFGDWAFFGSATFGEFASFSWTRFGRGLAMLGVRFGSNGGITEALVTTAPPASRRRDRWNTWWQRLWLWCDWDWVRAVGELQVLTRVSYAALVIVPLMAGGWQALRVVLNGSHQAVREARQEFDASARTLNEALDRFDDRVEQGIARLESEPADAGAALTQKVWESIPPEDLEALAGLPRKLSHVVEKVQQRVDRLDREHGPDSWSTHDLPFSWVLGYFAALAVTLGHLAYQVWAPEEVKKFGRDAWRERRNKEFREATDREERDLLERAFPYFEEIAGRRPFDRHPNLVRHHGQTVWLPTRWEDLERCGTSQQEPTPTGNTGAEGSRPATTTTREPYNRRQLELIVIDEGAAAEYDLLAIKRNVRAWISLSLYVVFGGVPIIWLLILQVAAILDAAGYHWAANLVHWAASLLG